MPYVYRLACLAALLGGFVAPRQAVAQELPSLTAASAPAAVADGTPLILEFWAAWCKPCRSFAPIITRYARSNGDVRIMRVNFDEQKALAQQYNVRMLPTLVGIVNGKVEWTNSGVVDTHALDKLLDSLRVKATSAGPKVIYFNKHGHTTGHAGSAHYPRYARR